MFENHIFPPMGLGAKRMKLEDKLRALLYGAWLERGAGGMPDFMSSVVSLTSDLGTESGMMSYAGKGWKSLMPEWTGLTANTELQPDSGANEFDEGAADTIFEVGVTIPGMLHIINNMTLTIDEQLRHWERWLEGLRPIVSMLSTKQARDNFIATCITPFPERKCWEAKFGIGVPSIVEWRWSVISKAAGHRASITTPAPCPGLWNSCGRGGGVNSNQLVFPEFFQYKKNTVTI